MEDNYEQLANKDLTINKLGFTKEEWQSIAVSGYSNTQILNDTIIFAKDDSYETNWLFLNLKTNKKKLFKVKHDYNSALQNFNFYIDRGEIYWTTKQSRRNTIYNKLEIDQELQEILNTNDKNINNLYKKTLLYRSIFSVYKKDEKITSDKLNEVYNNLYTLEKMINTNKIADANLAINKLEEYCNSIIPIKDNPFILLNSLNDVYEYDKDGLESLGYLKCCSISKDF